MLSRSLNSIAITCLLGASVLSQEARADDAVVQTSAAGSSTPRAQIGRDQVSLPITLDFAKVLTFEHPARTIIIGNPGIIDGALSDEKTMVLTGKAVGATNMIVLGEGGREIANLRVHVSTNAQQVTTIDHGGVQQIYSCVDSCRPIGKADPAK